MSRKTELSEEQLEELVEEAIVDAYDEHEQRMGFAVMIQDGLALPFQTQMLGVDVTVEKVEMTQGGCIAAVCVKGKQRQRIPILDLLLPDPPPKGAEWIEAFRFWWGAGV